MKIHFEKVDNFVGIAVENGKPGEMLKILARDAITSDDPNFYTYIEQISNMFLSRAHILAGNVYQFLIVIHENLSADLYVNDFPVAVEIRSKKAIKQGEVVMQGDIADIRNLKFLNIEIVETDRIIYCFKVGWRFGLFFDLIAGPSPVGSEKLDINHAMLTIGALYRYLSFYHIYKVLESEGQFKIMLQDGWFPFIEILGEEYKELSKGYQDRSTLENRIQSVVDTFDTPRVEKVTEKWWQNSIFNSKKTLIQAGISAYLQNSQAGYINCIKNLCTEIEGVLRELYRSETGDGNVKCETFISYIIEKGRQKAGSDHSLFLPVSFLQYLKEIVFANFDVDTGKVELSRNSASHGVAEAEKYKKERALQMILILDQIYFYL